MHGDTDELLEEMQKRLDGQQRSIDQLQQAVAAAGAQRTRYGPLPQVFLAKKGSTDKQWQEQLFNSGSLVDFTGGRSVNADTLPGALTDLDDDQFALIAYYDAVSGAMRYRKIGGGGGTIVPLQLTQTGGSQGTSAAAPTYTYTVKDITGTTTYATGVTPSHQRTKGAVKKALIGLGTTAGVVYWSDEIPDAGC